MTNLKCYVIGDYSADKWGLITSITTGIHSPDPIRQWNSKESSVNVTLHEEQYCIDFWNPSGGEDFDRLRPLGFAGTHVFLLCFSLVDPSSYDNISLKWIPMIRHYAPNIPIILLGTQYELRDDDAVIKSLEDRKLKPITNQDGRGLMEKVEAVSYFECSAVTRHRIDAVLGEISRVAVQTFLTKLKKNKRSCRLT